MRGNSTTKFVKSSEADKKYYRENKAEIRRKQAWLRLHIQVSMIHRKWRDNWAREALSFSNVVVPEYGKAVKGVF